MAWVRNLVVTVLVAVIIGWFVLSAREQSGFVVPPVDGFMEGQRIRFIHTEASDPEVSKLLTEMKGSPVLIVPSLAKAPGELLANVYVFTNGVPGDGPFKFQPDVFDNPPGHAGYTPLRALSLVAWKQAEKARELKSAAEVTQALAARRNHGRAAGGGHQHADDHLAGWPPLSRNEGTLFTFT